MEQITNSQSKILLDNHTYINRIVSTSTKPHSECVTADECNDEACDHDNSMSNALPFQSSDAEFESFIKASYTMQISQNDMDKLSQLKFNPFWSNKNIALSDNNNKELDTFFNTNTIVCDYLLPKILKHTLKNSVQKLNFQCYI